MSLTAKQKKMCLSIIQLDIVVFFWTFYNTHTFRSFARSTIIIVVAAKPYCWTAIEPAKHIKTAATDSTGLLATAMLCYPASHQLNSNRFQNRARTKPNSEWLSEWVNGNEWVTNYKDKPQTVDRIKSTINNSNNKMMKKKYNTFFNRRQYVLLVIT